MELYSIDENPSTVNPGKVLRDLLAQLFPIEKELEAYNFLDEIDDSLIAEGELKKVVYDSVINYFARRLIRMAQYKYNKNSEEDNTSDISLEEIRSFLKNQTKIDPRYRLRVSVLLNVAAKQKRGGGQGLINNLLADAKAQVSEARCYICGREVSFIEKDDKLYAEVEHIWPLTMGGSNAESNLKIACKACNKEKAAYVDSSDFHFEHLVCRNHEEKPTFHNEFNWHFKVAGFLKSDSKCILCNNGAENGNLMLYRSNTNDCWHYLNLDAYCEDHYNMVRSLEKGNND